MANDNKNYVVLDINKYNEMVFNSELMKKILKIYMENTEVNCIDEPNLTYEGQKSLSHLIYESNTNLKEKVKELVNKKKEIEEKNKQEEENEAND